MCSQCRSLVYTQRSAIEARDTRVIYQRDAADCPQRNVERAAQRATSTPARERQRGHCVRTLHKSLIIRATCSCNDLQTKRSLLKFPRGSQAFRPAPQTRLEDLR